MDLKKILLLGGVGLTSAAVGVVLPTMMSGGHEASAPKKDAEGHDAGHGHEAAASGHDAHAEAPKKADDHGGGHGGDHGGHGKEVKKVIKVGPCFLPFGQIVVNLNESNLTKFLSLDISVQTDGKFEDEVKDALEAKRPVLRTWLTSHLADKSIEDIRGKVGVNRLRREIQDNFNSLLFKDGHERVNDILFEEFRVE